MWAPGGGGIGLSALDFSGFSVYNISMKKLLFISFSFISMLFLSGVLFAQANLARGAKGVSAAVKGASSSVRAGASVKVPVVRLPVTSAVKVPSVSAVAAPHIPKTPVPLATPPAAASSQVTAAPSPEALRIQRLERSVQNLQKENQQLKTVLSRVQSPLLRATFQAVETTDLPTNPFSGTVFKTVYNGEEEVFGVVAAHAIASSARDKALKRHFTVGVFDGEKMVELPAEIVQVSSPSMLDIALVKFSPETEALFHPLRISEVPVKFGDVLSSHGFAKHKDVNIADRQIMAVTPLSVRTTLPFAREDRPGLCGSAVVNENSELVGIHTGSAYDRMDARFDIGYATNASFLNTLVEAYHNGGEATFPLMLNKQKVIDLNVDEYISYVSFQDETGKQLWQQGFENKFSYSKVQEMLEIYNPRYITVTVRRAGWSETDPEVLVENRTSRDLTKTTYKYDFEAQEIISVSKAKDKKGRR